MDYTKGVLKLVLHDIIGNIIYFPIWWYTKGTLHLLQTIHSEVQDLVRTLNLKTLARFLFTPMYGLNDIVSRLISFPVRVVHFCILSAIALVYIAGLTVMLLFWLIFPIFVMYNVLYQLHIVSLNIYSFAWN